MYANAAAILKKNADVSKQSPIRSSRNKSPSKTPLGSNTVARRNASSDRVFLAHNSPVLVMQDGHLQATGQTPQGKGGLDISPPVNSLPSTGRMLRKRSPVNVNSHPSNISRLHDGRPKQPAASLANLQPPSAASEPSQIRIRQKTHRDQTSNLFQSSIKHIGDALSDEKARERRLHRFNNDMDHETNSRSFDQGVEQSLPLKGGSKFPNVEKREHVLDQVADMEDTDAFAERDWQSTEPILGTCPDMCPESERFERERKGDLDRLERLHGDRNQTSRDLAVKKYTRTAEKHSSLIRPIPVLSMTMEHLLGLLNRSYDDELLGLHNFLWDRMRAIRMDLRMQHIFDLQAVVMHEQMIRFHILAMHELCEYAKGERFSEGFDAHLNIEQMNKASVDLFHMYDDLQKSGKPCPNEAEFRGYYALLKLDKHPGYVVEPAELSLDLAKMTPEMRNMPEVHFARKVARACRSGNYLAFFKLARDATYLQACLMHAHFSKLRSNAMASLYSGLQKNQGIPVSQVAEWLAMEGEDVEALVEYHGLSMKNFEEPYMVKEGPFLKKDQDFRTHHSRLVEEKRSKHVRDDVLSSGKLKASVEPIFERTASLRRQSDMHSTEPVLVDEEMSDYEEEEFVEETDKYRQPLWKVKDVNIPTRETIMRISATINNVSMASENLSEYGSLERDEENKFLFIGKRRKSYAPMEEWAHSDRKVDNAMINRETKIRKFADVSVVAAPIVEAVMVTKLPVSEKNYPEEENDRQVALKAEADRHRIRSILRKWRARAAHKAEENVWRQNKLKEALHVFHLGLPVTGNKRELRSVENSALSRFSVDFDIREIENKRVDMIEKMWKGLNVTDVVASILRKRSPARKFLCWKLLVCSRVHDIRARNEGRCNNAGEWLLAKLFNGTPSNRRIVMSSQGNNDEVPFYYIARDLWFKHYEVEDIEASEGANGLLFLLSESASLTEERGRLHGLVNMLHSGVRLPLLILYSELPESVKTKVCNVHNSIDEGSAIAELLDVKNLDKRKITCWTISSAVSKVLRPGKGSAQFFNEEILKEGISWLAFNAQEQSDLRSVCLPDLVMEHLQYSIKRLLDMEPEYVTPDMCVNCFNDSLLKTATKISAAASCSYQFSVPNELKDVLSESESKLLLPSPGWNEVANLEPILGVLRVCELPRFPSNHMYFENDASLKSQKVVLEEMLKDYIKQIYGLCKAEVFSILQAVDGIVQRSCTFKQTTMGRRLIPTWTSIFQHLFNMRLAILNSQFSTIVWVQMSEPSLDHGMPSIPDITIYSGPTVDDMIEMEIQESQAKRDSCLHNVAQQSAQQTSSKSALWIDGDLLSVYESDRTGAFIEDSWKPYSNETHGVRQEFEKLLEERTEAELELESMVNDFCRKVDTKRAEVEQDEVHIITNIRDKVQVSAENIEMPSNVSSMEKLLPVNDFTRLVGYCESVQATIDRRLEECFRIG